MSWQLASQGLAGTCGNRCTFTAAASLTLGSTRECRTPVGGGLGDGPPVPRLLVMPCFCNYNTIQYICNYSDRARVTSLDDTGVVQYLHFADTHRQAGR